MPEFSRRRRFAGAHRVLRQRRRRGHGHIHVTSPYAISRDLGASVSGCNGPSNAYALVLASFLLLAGPPPTGSGAAGSSESALVAFDSARCCAACRGPAGSSGAGRAGRRGTMLTWRWHHRQHLPDRAERARAIGVFGSCPAWGWCSVDLGAPWSTGSAGAPSLGDVRSWRNPGG